MENTRYVFYFLAFSKIKRIQYLKFLTIFSYLQMYGSAWRKHYQIIKEFERIYIIFARVAWFTWILDLQIYSQIKIWFQKLQIFVCQGSWRKIDTKLLLQNSLDLCGLLRLAWIVHQLCKQAHSWNAPLTSFFCLFEPAYFWISTFVPPSLWMMSSFIDCLIEKVSSRRQ